MNKTQYERAGWGAYWADKARAKTFLGRLRNWLRRLRDTNEETYETD